MPGFNLLLQNRIDDVQVADQRIGVLAIELHGEQVRPALLEQVSRWDRRSIRVGDVLVSNPHDVQEIGGRAQHRAAVLTLAVVETAE